MTQVRINFSMSFDKYINASNRIVYDIKQAVPRYKTGRHNFNRIYQMVFVKLLLTVAFRLSLYFMFNIQPSAKLDIL